MTFEEAGKIICNFINANVGIRNGKHLLFTAIHKALEAIAIQIPQKAIPFKVNAAFIKIRNETHYKNKTIFICPVCQQFISLSNKHCHHCGKKIDWSDIT